MMHGQVTGIMKVLASLIVSPLHRLLGGFLILRLMNILLFAAKPSANTGLRYAQFVTAAGLAFSHGANDAQKSMGMLTLALLLGGFIPTFEVPFWVMLACAIAITLGILSGGWRIVRTLGFRDLPRSPDPRAEFATDLGGGDPDRVGDRCAGLDHPRRRHVDHGHRCLGAAESRALEEGQGHRHYLGHHHSRLGPGCHSDIRSRQSLSRKGLIMSNASIPHHPPSLAASCIGSFRRVPNFFALLAEQSAQVGLSAGLLVDYMGSGTPEVAKRVVDAEHEGDRLKVRNLTLLNEAFSTPIDREDLHRAIINLDEIINSCKTDRRRDGLGCSGLKADKYCLEMACT
jgi:hypothetical protein